MPLSVSPIRTTRPGFVLFWIPNKSPASKGRRCLRSLLCPTGVTSSAHRWPGRHAANSRSSQTASNPISRTGNEPEFAARGARARTRPRAHQGLWGPSPDRAPAHHQPGALSAEPEYAGDLPEQRQRRRHQLRCAGVKAYHSNAQTIVSRIRRMPGFGTFGGGASPRQRVACGTALNSRVVPHCTELEGPPRPMQAPA